MKKAICCFIFSLFLLQSQTACCQKNPSMFHIKGKVNGRDTGVMYLSYRDDTMGLKRDTTYLRNGYFEFVGKISQPTSAVLYGRKKIINNNQVNFVTFLLDPGINNVLLTQDEDDKAEIHGSRSQDIYEKYLKDYYVVRGKYNTADSLYLLAKQQIEKGIDSVSVKRSLDSLKAEYEQIERKALIEYDSLRLAYTAKYPNEYVSAFLFTSVVENSPVEECLAHFQKLSPRVRNSKYGKLAVKEIAAKQGWAVGYKAANFSTTDIDSNKIELASFIGNSYVLLDFWASWCVPCRQGSPNMIKWYNAYHAKGFEIIGIANDDTRIAAWKKAIKTDGTGAWKHVLQQAGTANDIGKLFAVQPIPDKILIDKNGVIIYRYAGGDKDEKLEKLLQEIFEK
jgi:thiol-disulfide isomerase/thioredoxin